MPLRIFESQETRFIAWTLVSWAGMVAHNLGEFPSISPLRAEYLFPTGIYGVLLIGWLSQTTARTTWACLALIWAATHLVVGGLSVFPLTIWPFTPRQSVPHYLVHAAYAASQIPLIWDLRAWIHVRHP